MSSQNNIKCTFRVMKRPSSTDLNKKTVVEKKIKMTAIKQPTIPEFFNEETIRQNNNTTCHDTNQSNIFLLERSNSLEVDNITDSDIGVWSSQESAVNDAKDRQVVLDRDNAEQQTDGGVPIVQFKTIKDSIHGSISMEPGCMKIIDSTQFQRLRTLHQLGAANFVFPGATHTRFEHCLGVAVLSEKMAKKIRKAQPNLNISDVDILCVKIAGLCHDLGHGPFSHVFDGLFMKAMGIEWCHEQGSIAMFDYMLHENNLDHQSLGLSSENDIVFIKELIMGGPLPDNNNKLIGRQSSKSFLYDIVNNSHSGLDVDKLDYMARDAFNTNTIPACDFKLIIKLARVLPDFEDINNRLTICYPEKYAEQVSKVFKTRFELHQEVYQHKVVKGIEFMIRDILINANDHLKIKGVKISQCPFNMDAYQVLDDSILNQIWCSENPELKEAQELYRRILNRQLYKFVGETRETQYSKKLSADEICREICFGEKELTEEMIEVDRMRVHHGKKKDNPVASVRFFSKNSSSSDFCHKLAEEVYESHSHKFQMQESIRIYVRIRSKHLFAYQALHQWCKSKNMSEIQPSFVGSP